MYIRLVVALLSVVLTVACGSDKKSSNPTQPVCTVSAVTVSPASLSLPVSQTATLAPAITQQNCGPLTPTWASTNQAVATVSSAGVVAALAPGTSSITATVNGVQGSALVTVPAPAPCVTAVSVSPASATLSVPLSTVLTVTVTPANCPGATVSWSSSSSAVATVANGNVTAVAPGTATITATVGGMQAISTIVVQAAQLGSNWDETLLRLAGGGDAPNGYISAAWAASPTDVFATAYPFYYRFNGTNWTKLAGNSFGVAAMWGSSASDVFGVGETLRRFNGTAWTEMSSPTTQRLRAVWGSGPTNVFAVGQGGTIIRFNGTSWSQMLSPTTANLTGVSGVGPNLAFAVAENGGMIKFDGTQWTMVSSPTTNFLTAVWMASSTLGYAVGLEGAFKYNGTSWSADPTYSQVNFVPRAVWGSSPSNVVLAGSAGQMMRFDGVTWNGIPRKTSTEFFTLTGSGATSFAFASNVTVQSTGNTSTLLTSAPDLRSVWAVDANTAFAVGDDGVIWKYANGAWQSQSTGTLARFNDVWAASPTQAIAVGVDVANNASVAYRFDGLSWQPVALTGTAALVSLWGTSFSNLIAGSRFSPLQRFNGTAWSSATATNPGDLIALWGTSDTDYLLVGSEGFAARFDGAGGITRLSTGTTVPFVSVWGSSPNNYFIGTNQGSIWRFNGTSFTPMTVPQNLSAVYALWGTGPSQLFAVDFNGGVIRFDGTQWVRLREGGDNSFFNAVHGVASKLFAVGPGGAAMVTR